MRTLSPGTSWDAALEQLTALPGELQHKHGEANFMRAGSFRRNGRRLFDEAIVPLLQSGREFEVVAGFVDPAIAAEADIPLRGGAGEFLSAKLRDTRSGEVLEVSVAA